MSEDNPINDSAQEMENLGTVEEITTAFLNSKSIVPITIEVNVSSYAQVGSPMPFGVNNDTYNIMFSGSFLLFTNPNGGTYIAPLSTVVPSLLTESPMTNIYYFQASVLGTYFTIGNKVYKNGVLLQTITIPNFTIYSMAVSPNGQYLAIQASAVAGPNYFSLFLFKGT
jgi:hypothetical protein